eukprot:5507434-Ditylum_brightwellii.AAC.1
MEEEEGGSKENISKKEDIIGELYLEHVVCEEDKCESDEEDKEDCNAGKSDEGSPSETKQDDHVKPTA